MAAGTTNTPFQFKIVPIPDLKEHPKLTLIISNGAFEQGVKGGPQIKCYTRDQWGQAFCTLIKAHAVLIVIHFLTRSIATALLTKFLFFFIIL